ERDGIEHPRAIHAARIAVHVVGDAVLADEPAALLPALRDLDGAELLDAAPELLVVRAGFALGRERLVVGGRAGLVAEAFGWESRLRDSRLGLRLAHVNARDAAVPGRARGRS